MELCLRPFGEDVARQAQFIGAEEESPGPVEEIAERWYKASSDLNHFARENPVAALGAVLVAGVLIGVIIGSH